MYTILAETSPYSPIPGALVCFNLALPYHVKFKEVKFTDSSGLVSLLLEYDPTAESTQGTFVVTAKPAPLIQPWRSYKGVCKGPTAGCCYVYEV